MNKNIERLRNTVAMLLFFISLSTTLHAQDQIVNIKGNNITLKSAFEQIEKQTNLKIGYEETSINVNTKITGIVKSKVLKDVLSEILKGTNCSFKFQNGHIFIFPIKKNSNEQKSTKSSDSEKEISGKITDAETGESIIGATISLNGKAVGITDIDGKFKTSVPENSILTVKSIGYASKDVKTGSSTLFDIKLSTDTQALNEVVVTAFGSEQKRTSMVGSVQSIKPSDLKVPSANLSSSFAGRMAGVIAFQRSGQPGADGANFYIRGISTISGATSPLIILDGVQVSPGDLNALDPEVIEGFSILKDATATALYGTRGANGVMIVTTKSGTNLDKPKINFRFEANVTQPTNIPKYADGTTFMNLFNEAATNLGSGVVLFTPEQIKGTMENANPYVFPNVNWYKELFKNQAFNQKFNFNIRGGGQKLDYFMSASVNNETGMLQGRSKDYFSFDNNIHVRRYAFQNNINAHLGKTSKISLRLNAQMMNNRGPNFDNLNSLFSYAITANPVDFPVMYPADGLTQYIKWGAFKFGSNAAFNPVASMVSGYRDSFESTVIANLEFEQKLDFITRGLRFNALGSFKNWSSTSIMRQAPYNTFKLTSYDLQPDGTYNYRAGLNDTEQTVVLNSSSNTTGDRRVYLQAILDYNRTFYGLHSVNAMLVYNQDDYNLNNLTADNSFSIMINSLPRRRQGAAARLSYAYDNKYLFEVNAGYNGSENFAKGHRWGFFPSVALGYNISEEKFFAPMKNVIQLLKIRGSWGLVGNDQIGGDRFVYLSNIALQSESFRTGINMDYELKGPKYSRYANYDLTWEVGEKINLGLDLRVLQDLNIVLDFFKENRRNIFQQRGTIPNYLGTAGTVVYGNTAQVLNKGFDLSLDYSKRVNKDFAIYMKGTFTFARNKILKYDEPADQDYPNLINVGKKLNMNWGYIADGLFIDQAEIDNSPTQKISGNMAPGDIKYKNFPNRDGKYDNQIDNYDRIAIGYPTVPEIVYGFGPNVQIKGWDFGVFFQGVANTSLMMSGFHPFGTNTRNNVAQWIVDSHWSPDNQNIYAKYPRLTKDDHGNNTTSSTFWLRDASFLKLKNAEIGYTYHNMRLYLSGVNLLTFSKFKLWDPEQGGGNGLSYPTQRVLSIGFQMNIN